MENIQSILEKKAYDETCDKAILEAIKNRVFVYEPGIIYYKELPVVTPFTIALLSSCVITLGSQFDKWGVIIDLTEAPRPDAVSRRAINEQFADVSAKATHIGYYTKGFLLNTAIRFVMFGSDTKTYSVSSNFDNILKSVRKSLE